MVKQMNKIMFYSFVTISILIILIPTIININNIHDEKLVLVTEKRIIESAIKCQKEDLCTDEKITLKQLYEFNLLEKEADPITKMYYSEDSYVIKKEDTYEFISQ